ncbi:MAG: hypothetical protein ACI8RZ_004992 [Myxococcota bacterium]|jgi:hypothetical protein
MMAASSVPPASSSPPDTPGVLLLYANPAQTADPVPPYGMERIGTALTRAGCDVTLLSPFMTDAPVRSVVAALAEAPALVGVSVRNLDDALSVRSELGAGVIDTNSTLTAIRPLIAAAVKAVGVDRVVLGGAGIAAGGEAVIAALGARWGIIGPADDLAAELGARLVAGQSPLPLSDPRMADAANPRTRPPRFARAFSAPIGPTTRDPRWLSVVAARQSAVPVEVATGCDRRCWFCMEARAAGQRVYPRPVPAVVAEVDALIAAGVETVWLSASELNVPDDAHAIAVLRALSGRDVTLRFFLQAAPISPALLDAIEDCGIDPATVPIEAGHLDDRILRAGGGPANRSHLDALVGRWVARGYSSLSLSVIFGAHPLETEQTLEAATSAARQIDAALPEGLSLSYSCGARVYARSPLADWIRAHPEEAAPDLYGAVGEGDFAAPVVFCRPLAPRRMLARVKGALWGMRGDSGPLNTELAETGSTEAAINHSLWQWAEGERAAALTGLADALAQDPDHLAALSQQARLLHADGQRDATRAVLSRLLEVMPQDDPRHGEISAALSRW